MATDVSQAVASLTTHQALAASRALTVLLDLRLQEAGANAAAGTVDLSDFGNLLSKAGPDEQALYSRLDEGKLTDEAAGQAAKSLLVLAADAGYPDLVVSACTQAKAHVRDFGILSVPLILAGLAVVLAWVPAEQRHKVAKSRQQQADGSVVETETIETETIRVGAAAAEKLAPWFKAWLSPGT
jgi:hypothetical protein